MAISSKEIGALLQANSSDTVPAPVSERPSALLSQGLFASQRVTQQSTTVGKDKALLEAEYKADKARHARDCEILLKRELMRDRSYGLLDRRDPVGDFLSIIEFGRDRTSKNDLQPLPGYSIESEQEPSFASAPRL